MDSRTFCVLMQLARRRSVAEVKALMHAPETPVQGLARVRRQVRTGHMHAGAFLAEEMTTARLHRKHPSLGQHWNIWG